MTGRATVRVGLGSRAYDILIGPDLLAEAGARIQALGPKRRAAVVTDATVAELHLAPLLDTLRAAGMAAEPVILPPGESTKSLARYGELMTTLLDLKIGRDDLVVAFGGGVIGDLAGFAAATLKRGVDVVQIPTTLLAQVDSSVGGKTGVNAPQGKNLIGAFLQPKLVLADTSVLDTLSAREFKAGYGEVVKYGLLGDAGFFDWLETAGRTLAGDQAARIEAVRRSCQMKADIVARDEMERGDRALLNLGHTFGHALEAATGYSDRLLHGEGVAAGMVLAFETSMRLGLCSQETPSRVRAHFAAMGLCADLSDIPGDLPDADGLISYMSQDKKVKDGQVVFILARGIGEAFVATDVDMDVVRGVLTDALAAR